MRDYDSRDISLELDITRIQLAQSVTYVAKPLLYPTQITVHFVLILRKMAFSERSVSRRLLSVAYFEGKISRYLSFTEWLLLYYNIRP